MVTDLGYVALILALVLAVYGIVVSLIGARRNMPELVASGRNAVYVVGALVLVAAVLLWRPTARRTDGDADGPHAPVTGHLVDAGGQLEQEDDDRETDQAVGDRGSGDGRPARGRQTGLFMRLPTPSQTARWTPWALIVARSRGRE